ncbi:predicted protein [Sclerotinia sclerotiorum 1980 UF-70]|uniref:Uncharacterized protein n=2 Tax=Sclerotinia sclerotiorum (strain ATCC 18683 / 1980 / Ss-1) TaxID=665079 RepID=A0A1D9QLG4_SCLS1|nr:predicted protein [Sclerotinia sclerotiorum 1980 UF-70]APA15652.1 hypothetical protein sscle_15g104220 [Sclerotinia sclerotiorum 1980 UF-70]EDN93669.1 predicted protein [Sclerotinia sclerotiorum 1980 UF-70]
MLKTTDTNTVSDHSYKTTINFSMQKITVWIEIGCLLSCTGLLIYILVSLYKMTKSIEQNRTPRYGNESQAEKGGLKDSQYTIVSKTCEEKYHDDASVLTGIPTPEQDSGNAIASESIVNFGKESVAEENKCVDSLEENFLVYCYYPSPLWDSATEEEESE